MKQLLVVEDEKGSVKPAFDAANSFVLNSSYQVCWVEKSQDIPMPISQFSALFIDLSISKTSKSDGFGIISDIRKTNPDLLKRVAIITANSLIEKEKVEKNVDDITIFIKPLSYKLIADFVKRVDQIKDE